MRKLLGWVAFAATTIGSMTLAAIIFFKTRDITGSSMETMEYQLELFLGTSLVVTISLASTVRHWVTGTKPKEQKASHVR